MTFSLGGRNEGLSVVDEEVSTTGIVVVFVVDSEVVVVLVSCRNKNIPENFCSGSPSPSGYPAANLLKKNIQPGPDGNVQQSGRVPGVGHHGVVGPAGDLHTLPRVIGVVLGESSRTWAGINRRLVRVKGHGAATKTTDRPEVRMRRRPHQPHSPGSHSQETAAALEEPWAVQIVFSPQGLGSQGSSGATPSGRGRHPTLTEPIRHRAPTATQRRVVWTMVIDRLINGGTRILGGVRTGQVGLVPVYL